MPTAKEKKTENILIAAIFALILILGSVFAWNKYKDSDTEESPPPPPPNPKDTAPVANDNFPLVKGNAGENVKYLQGAINRIVTNPALKVTEDGKFGDKTYTSLISGVGITTWWDTTKINTYPVTLNAFNSIMKKSNANRFMMDGKIYQTTSIVDQP